MNAVVICAGGRVVVRVCTCGQHGRPDVTLFDTQKPRVEESTRSMMRWTVHCRRRARSVRSTAMIRAAQKAVTSPQHCLCRVPISRSQFAFTGGNMVAKLVGATSSEGFLYYCTSCWHVAFYDCNVFTSVGNRSAISSLLSAHFMPGLCLDDLDLNFST